MPLCEGTSLWQNCDAHVFARSAFNPGLWSKNARLPRTSAHLQSKTGEGRQDLAHRLRPICRRQLLCRTHALGCHTRRAALHRHRCCAPTDGNELQKALLKLPAEMRQNNMPSLRDRAGNDSLKTTVHKIESNVKTRI